MLNNPYKQKDPVPLRYARSILKVADAQGYKVADILSSVGLTTNPLSPSADLDTMIDGQYYSEIYHRVMSLLQDESFGLGLRRRMPAGSFRMMCLFVVHCDTLGQALSRAAEFTQFCHSFSDTPYSKFEPVERLNNGTAIYYFPSSKELVQQGDSESVVNVAHTMAIWRRFCQWLIGKPLELIAVHFQDDDSQVRRYAEQLFDCDIQLGKQHNAFVIAEHSLDCPLIHTEESLQRFLRDAPYLLMISQDNTDSSLLSQMKRIVGNDLSQEFPSVIAMAETLNMSVRTLRRRLKDQGITYQSFKDGLRKEHAIRWLNQPELKINAVSALLGFDEPSTFHRSFKKWTGVTPGEYRQRSLAKALKG